MFSEYVGEIYKTLIETPRAELKQINQELQETVPAPMHSMLDKQNKEESIQKYKERKEICPPTCTGIIIVSYDNK